MLLPEKTELEYINQFPFFKKKVEKVYELLESQNIGEAERICLGLAEAIGLVFLKKKYSVEPSNVFDLIVWTASELIHNNERKLAEQYVSINGNLNTSDHDVDDVGSFLYDIDFLLETIIKENAGFGEAFQSDGESNAADVEGIIGEIRKWVLLVVDSKIFF